MDIDWAKLGYVVACLALPAVWGVVAAKLFSRLDRRRKARADAAAAERPPIDYVI
jgi:hypothetical protein